MAIDEQTHVALPKLYGAPAYGRPRRPAEPIERPVDPDELPLEAFATEEEREVLSDLRQQPYTALPIRPEPEGPEPQPQARPRPFLLRALAGRLLRES